MTDFDTSLADFTKRIIKNLDLFTTDTIMQRKEVLKWIAAEKQSIQAIEELNQKEERSSFFAKILRGKNKAPAPASKDYQEAVLFLENLMNYTVPATYEIPSILNMPLNIIEIITALKGKEISKDCYEVRGPMLKLSYCKNQTLKAVLQLKDPVDGLRFTRVGPETVQRYQRIFIRELFAKIFRSRGALALVLHFQPQKDISGGSPTFLLVEDVSVNPDQIVPMENIQFNSEKMRLEEINTGVPVNVQSILELLVSELMVLPLESLVPRFIGIKEGNQIFLSRWHSGRSDCLLEHPSLRSALFFFREFFDTQEVPIEYITKVSSRNGIYKRFFTALQIVINLQLDDFTVTFTNERKALPSSLFNTEAIISASHMFHKIVVCDKWLIEVVKPLKSAIKIRELIDQIWPILAEINVLQVKDVREYMSFVQKLEIENFLSTQISKASLNNYLEYYKIFHIEALNKELTAIQDRPTVANQLHELYWAANIEAFPIEQSVHLIQFYLQNIDNPQNNLPPSWKSLPFWKKVFQWIEKTTINTEFIDVNVDFCPYYLDFDPVFLNLRDSFSLLAHTEENQKNMHKINLFLGYLQDNYKWVSKQRIVLLFERCLQYGKIKFARMLLEHDVSKFNLNYLFNLVANEKICTQQEKEELIRLIEIIYPQTFRRYKWAQIFKVYLTQNKHAVPIFTFHYGQSYLPQQILKKILRKNGSLYQLQSRVISRSDYMYTLTQDVTKIQTPQFQMYVQQTPRPGVDYFMGKLLDKLEASYMKPMTTYMTLFDTYFKCSQSFPDGFSIPQAFKTYKEDEITSLVDREVLSEAIVICLLIYPMRVTFDDIIIRRSHCEKDKFYLYVKSIYCYSAYSQMKENTDTKLKVWNALFLLDIMQETVPMKIVEKYANMDVLTKIRQLFEHLKTFDERASELKSHLSNQHGSFLYQLPFLGIPFEKNFIVKLTHRFFTLSEQFKSLLSHKVKNLTHYDLFEKLDQPVALFYKQVRLSSSSLLERWDLLKRYETDGRGFVEQNLFSFFSSFSLWEPRDYSAFPEDLDKLKFVGPSQSLLKLSQDHEKFEVFLKKQAAAVKDMLQNSSTQIMAYYMNNLDMSMFTPGVQEEIITLYQEASKKYLQNPNKYKALQGFCLLSSTVLKDKSFTGFSYERVQYFILSRCDKVTELDLAYLASRLSCVTYLRLSHINSLQCFSSKRSFAVIHEQPLTFKSLKTLCIHNCQDLSLIDVKSSSLANVELSRNHKLENIFIVSNHLTNINSIANPELRVENISMYILKGVNVLVDDISCFGHFPRILGEDLQTGDYTKKVCQLFTYLISKFDDLKNNLLVTMFKTKLLDDNLSNEIFTFFSAIVSKLISSNVKLTPKLEQDLLSNLIKCFFRNSRIQEIHLDYFHIMDDKFKAKTFSKLITCMKEVSKTTPVLYKSIHIDKSLTETSLQMFVETTKYIHKNDTLDFSFASVHDNPKPHIEILKNLTKPGTLHKLRLTVKSTALDSNLLVEILEVCALPLGYLRLQGCNVHSEKVVRPEIVAEKCKSLILSECELQSSFDFLERFKNLSSIEIQNCKILDLEQLLNELKTLEQLSSLSLKHTMKSSADLISVVGYLQNNKIESLNLSGSSFSNSDMDMISKLFETINIKEFTLLKLGLNADYNLSSFLSKSKKLKKISIELDSLPHINQFIEALGPNKSITTVQLVCNIQYTSLNLEPLKQNDELEEFNFNHRLPMWLITKLENNIKYKVSHRSSVFNAYSGDFTELYHLNTKNKQDYFKIGLSLDGGGMRGLMLASELQYLAKGVNKPFHKIFDCIGGTSIGGILALSITGTLDGINPVCDQNQILNIFETYGPDIFKKTAVSPLVSLFGSRYPASGIETVLNGYFGNCKLSDVMPGTSVIVTSVKRIDNRVKIFKSKEAILDISKNFFMRDVARSTSAAPIYFPAASIKNIQATKEYSLIDGGLGLNNPSKLVIDEIKKAAINQGAESNYFLLSLGTGRSVQEGSIPKNAGLLNVAPVIDSFTESSNYFIERDIAMNYKGHYLRVSPVFNQARKDLELDNTTPEIMKLYKKQGVDSATEYFSNLGIFGPYHDRSLIEWLAENTDKKYEMA